MCRNILNEQELNCPNVVCHSSKINAIGSIPLDFELWKLELMGVTAVQRGWFVQQQGFQVLIAKF